MDSKSLSAQMKQSAIMAQLPASSGARLRHKQLPCCAPFMACRSPTKSVDNFVGNPSQAARKVASLRGCNRLMKNCAVKNPYKSTACTCKRAMQPLLTRARIVTVAGAVLWSTPLAQAPSNPAVADA
ncbi:hypothetical protein [Acidovorax sp. LjRoot194]|uniref:hypothetical protein n=1 Tax=Acidovorax sp. LjRoot194 TaxID=3342280 RepID=UPI003F509570